jgi:recombination protein RecA
MGNLDIVINEINKKFGSGTIRSANEFIKLDRISTGVFALDVEIGGGIPKGRVVIFAGNESTSKTTTAKLCIAQFQNTCKNCLSHLSECSCGDTIPHKAVFVDIEGAFDSDWFSKLGGNLDELLLLQPEFAEQAVDIVEALIRTGEVDIIVVDSIAMLSPSAEIEKSAEDFLVGAHARLTNRMMRSVQASLNSLGMSTKHKPAIILINQFRTNVGVMYGNTDVFPGGRGQKFASSITLKFTARPSERVYDSTAKKKGEDPPVGIRVRFLTEKNKTFLPLRSGSFVLYISNSEELGAVKGSVDTVDQVIEYGVKYGIIDKSGGWFTIASGNSEWDTQYHGKTELFNALATNKQILDGIKGLVMQKIMVETSSTIVEEDA